MGAEFRATREQVATMMDEGCVVLRGVLKPKAIVKMHHADLVREGFIVPPETDAGADIMDFYEPTPTGEYPFGMQGEATRPVHAVADQFVMDLAAAMKYKMALIAHDQWCYETHGIPRDPPHRLVTSEAAALTHVRPLTGWFQCSGSYVFNYWPGTHIVKDKPEAPRPQEVGGFNYDNYRFREVRAKPVHVNPGDMILFFSDLLHLTTRDAFSDFAGDPRRRLFFAAGMCQAKGAGFHYANELRQCMGLGKAPLTQAPPLLPSGNRAFVTGNSFTGFLKEGRLSEYGDLLPVPVVFEYTPEQAAMYFPHSTADRRPPSVRP